MNFIKIIKISDFVLSVKKSSVFFAFVFLFLFFYMENSFAKHEELRIGVNSEYETLHPILSSSAVARYMIYFSYRPLVYLDEQSQVRPMIVKKVPSLTDKSASLVFEKSNEKSPSKNIKKLVATWEFIEGLKWGDGVPITCKDLKFAWQFGLNPNVSLPTKDDVDDIEDVIWNEKEPTKCQVKYKVAKWDFVLRTPSPLPEHLEKEIFQKFGSEKEGYEHNSLYQKNPATKGLWNGPYLVSEAKLGSHIVLVPNENFYGPKPKIKKIIIKIITNSGVLEANLRSKNLDMISRIGLDFDQALALRSKLEEEKLPYQIVFQDGVTYYHLDINLDHPILKDIKVRKALSFGLNKQEILNSVFEGKATLAHHFTSPLDRLYTEDKKIVTFYEPDKRKAKTLLEEAGWVLDPDGYRYKKGQKLSFSLSLDAESKVNETFGSIIQAQWKTLGVDLQVKSEVARFLFTEVIPKRKFDLAMFAWISFPENSQKAVMSSKNIPSEKNTWTGQNFTGYINFQADKFADAYEYELDPQKRKHINDELIKLYTRDIPVLPLYFRSENAVIPKNMKNFKLTGHLYFESLKAEEWEW